MAKKIFDYFENRPRLTIGTVMTLLTIVGIADYSVGPTVSLLVFYLIPICLATWFMGKRFGLITALFSIGIWAFSNELATDDFTSPFVSGWNIFSALAVFVVVVILLSKFELFMKRLEAMVAERTLALRRLEKDILEISERERRRIGHDLHDTVCQILTGTTIAIKVLEGKLTAKGLPEAVDAREIKSLVQQSIEIARNMARGLSPIAMTAEGLMDAFHQLAERISKNGKIFCLVDYDDPLLVHNVDTATHLYLIVQEAVMNAVKHSKGTRIVIRLKCNENGTTIEIADNGVGLSQRHSSRGMGSRIMNYRAIMIGAELSISNASPNGTSVKCFLKNQILSSIPSKP